MAIKEAKVEEELYYLIKTVLKKHNFKLNDVEFGDIEPQHSVDGGIADLVLPFSDGKHFLVVECKRKITRPSGFRTIRDFDVFGSRVLNQALNYAVRLGSHAFATTNGARLALFRTPEAGEPFRIDTHRLLIQDPFRLEEKNVKELLDFLAKWHAGIPVRLIEIDWFFTSRLRSFVDFLSKSMKTVMKKLETDEIFSKRSEEFSKKIGISITKEQLARETAYLLMNKIIFYKILERHYKNLPKLKPISAPDGEYFIEFLKGYFEKAIEVTGDFEPIFITELYDDIPLPDLDYVFEEVNSFIEDMDTHKLEEVGSDVVGYIYEELIPDEERHRLGQFYTPPPIAELIVKWAVRSHKDVVLDPAVGSGTFLVKAYKRLKELKSEQYRKAKKRGRSGVIHKEIISQLYADDFNPFPAHLTSMNLAMRDVRYPTSEMNIIVEDFFNLRSKMNVLATYLVKTPKGEIERHIKIPIFDAIIANPPYTRWVEIPKKTQLSISKSIGAMLKKHKLTGGIGSETGIYAHFIMHALSFLRNKGRLGMIISNSWLQAYYGIRFANFLLDNFKIKAIIDFPSRLFRIPMVATCIILLEKEKDSRSRQKNQVAFMYIEKEAKVEEILDALDNPKGWKTRFFINIVRQRDLPRDDKWIKTMFKADVIEKAILNSNLIAKIEDSFTPRYGNILGIAARGGTGSNTFFYMDKERKEKRGLSSECLHPLLVSPRYSKYFIFTERDWKELQEKKKTCYAFMCHEPKSEMSGNTFDYVKWGETQCRTKIGKLAPESLASKMRENNKKNFFGWFDLGGVSETSIFMPRYAYYGHNCMLSQAPIAINESFIALIPKRNLDEIQTKAIAAYLNSTYNRFYIEINGRPGALRGGVALDLDQAKNMFVIDVTRLDSAKTQSLANLFDKLESETRRIGGAHKRKGMEMLQPLFDEIDKKVTHILGFDKSFCDTVKGISKILMDRRLSRAKVARPETVKGEEELKIRPPKKRKKRKEEEFHKPLTRWME